MPAIEPHTLVGYASLTLIMAGNLLDSKRAA